MAERDGIHSLWITTGVFESCSGTKHAGTGATHWHRIENITCRGSTIWCGEASHPLYLVFWLLRFTLDFIQDPLQDLYRIHLMAMFELCNQTVKPRGKHDRTDGLVRDCACYGRSCTSFHTPGLYVKRKLSTKFELKPELNFRQNDTRSPAHQSRAFLRSRREAQSAWQGAKQLRRMLGSRAEPAVQ